MCGISGGFNYFNKKINLRSSIEKIVKLQHLRGPDDNDIWESLDKKVCFGHNRLSIIDLSKNGKQPFVSADKKFIISFNGEIYNYRELKNELIIKGVIFKSNSDTEVIIESYKYWGIDFLNKLRGMFAFAIWDSLNKKLILARDPFGIKPLYYTNKSCFFFASEVKSLLSLKDISLEISNQGLASYYLWGNMQDPFTLYKDIKSLEMGTCLLIDEKGNQNTIKYADFKKTIIESEPVKIQNDFEKNEYLSEILKETIKYHQISDVPILILLSAGVDSNTILGFLDDEDKKNTKALTIDFNLKGDDSEIPISIKSAKLNKIDHLVEKIDKDEYKYLLNCFFSKMDLPSNDGFNNYIASYFAKKNNSKIVISGIGGDELFSGYPSFARIPRLNKYLNFIPENIKLKKFFKDYLSIFLRTFKIKSKYAGIFEYGKETSASFLLQRSLFLPDEIKNEFNEINLSEGIKELDIRNKLFNEIKEIKSQKLAIIFLEIKYYMCNKLLRDADWTSMSHSIELRTPLVDLFFFNKLIPLLKTNYNVNKKSMLNCIEKKIPNEIYKRKKTGFNFPQQKLMSDYGYTKKFNEINKNWSIFTYENYIKNNEKKN